MSAPSTTDLQPITADVSAERLALIYAEALLNAAAKENRVAEVLEELEGLIQDIFGREPQFEEFLASSAVGRDRKTAAINDTFTGRASELFVNFLHVLNEHDRLGLLRAIVKGAQQVYLERTNRARVFVRSAVPLPDDQKQRLTVLFQESMQREPIVDFAVDPALMGGLVVRMGDWVYDASVRMRLEQLRTQLIERSSHEIQSRRDRFSS